MEPLNAGLFPSFLGKRDLWADPSAPGLPGQVASLIFPGAYRHYGINKGCAVIEVGHFGSVTRLPGTLARMRNFK